MKSIYTRVVLTFLGSIVLGTVISFVVVTWMYQDELNDNLQVTLFDFGQDVVDIYEALSPEEADNFVSHMRQLNSYYIRIYDQDGLFKVYGDLQDHDAVPVTQEQLRTVLNGQISKMETNGINPVHIGMPMTIGSEHKAIFIQRNIASSSSFLSQWLMTFLLYSLIAGSILILIASMLLVKPIKKLTTATKRIAGGDFEVKLDIKQGGELGTLAQSFEDMAHDLQQLEQMRREFVSNVSHEIQSPLTSISGYAMALKQMNISNADRHRYLDIIIAESARMSKMSNSLLKLSLLEAQIQGLKYTSFGLDEQIRVVIVALQPQWSTAKIQFDLQLESVDICADYDLLNQVWTNIIGNSIKFSPQESMITISMLKDTDQVTIQITDTGIGISPEDQKRIFERFFKADRSHSRNYAGSGMGLAIVKKIVSLHQGEITLESSVGGGTTFIVTLPRSRTT